MMEHKAFLFDYSSFDRELRQILENALNSGKCGGLVSFINTHLEALRDPYEGEPLDAGWESLIEAPDAHQYGDFALTKYYDPLADIGLGVFWESVQDLIASDPTFSVSPILGSTIGPKHDPFDPGKMGAYFQSFQQAQQHHNSLLLAERTSPSPQLHEAVELLAKAVNEKKGLYVTF